MHLAIRLTRRFHSIHWEKPVSIVNIMVTVISYLFEHINQIKRMFYLILTEVFPDNCCELHRNKVAGFLKRPGNANVIKTVYRIYPSCNNQIIRLWMVCEFLTAF